MRILYHGATVYQVLSCIVHRMAYHAKDDTVLMIAEHYANGQVLENFTQKIKQLELFDDVWIVPEKEFKKKRGKKLGQKSSKTDIEQVIQNICQAFENWCPNFSEFEEIYVASDNWTVGIYCLAKKIPYHYFEDSCGILTDRKHYYDILRGLDSSNYVISNYLGGAGAAKTAIELICNLDYQKGDTSDERITHFSIYDTLKKQGTEQISKVLRLYDCEPYDMDAKRPVALFLTQKVLVLAVKDLNIQMDLTAILLDYFAEGMEIVFKPHPSDIYFDYEKIIKDSFVIRRSLPSELLPFMFDQKLKRAITASSTSIAGVEALTDESYSFSPDIEVNYSYLHVAYAMARIIEELKEERNIEINMKESSYLENFLKLLKIEGVHCTEYENYIFVETDNTPQIEEELDFKKLKKKDIILFDNYQNRYEFLLKYPDLNISNLLVWKLEVKQKDRKNIDIDHQIWLYCEDEQVREKLRKMEFTKELKNSNKTISLKPEQINQTLIMQGKIKALEYALSETKKQQKAFENMKNTVNRYQDQRENEEKFLLRDGVLNYRK